MTPLEELVVLVERRLRAVDRARRSGPYAGGSFAGNATELRWVLAEARRIAGRGG